MAHYYDAKPQGRAIEESIKVNARGTSLNFLTASGLFSKKSLDSGTKALIEYCDLSNTKKMLDLGCGYGAVGIFAKYKNRDLNVGASDVNLRAVQYTEKNAKLNKLEIHTVWCSLFEKMPDAMFDTILTNPPYVAGRDICYAFITESFKHLIDGGNLQLVARHQKGGKMLEKKMLEVFGNVETLGKQSGFRVYRSFKNQESENVEISNTSEDNQEETSEKTKGN